MDVLRVSIPILFILIAIGLVDLEVVRLQLQ